MKKEEPCIINLVFENFICYIYIYIYIHTCTRYCYVCMCSYVCVCFIQSANLLFKSKKSSGSGPKNIRIGFFENEIP